MGDEGGAVARLLRDKAQAEGLSISELAYRSNLNRIRVTRVLREERPMTVEELFRLCQGLMVSPDLVISEVVKDLIGEKTWRSYAERNIEFIDEAANGLI